MPIRKRHRESCSGHAGSKDGAMRTSEQGGSSGCEQCDTCRDACRHCEQTTEPGPGNSSAEK